MLKHSPDTEVLRASFFDNDSLICTGGADGVVKIWSNRSNSYSASIMELPHGPGEQVYVCEPYHNDGLPTLLTASNDSLYLWDLIGSGSTNSHTCLNKRVFYSMHGGDDDGYGGPRNPDNFAYIFDAKPNSPLATTCGGEKTVAVALSDGTLRVLQCCFFLLIFRCRDCKGS